MRPAYRLTAKFVWWSIGLAAIAGLALASAFVIGSHSVQAAPRYSGQNEAVESVDAQEADGQNNQDEANGEDVGVQEADGQNNQDETDSVQAGVQETDEANQDKTDSGNTGTQEGDQSNQGDTGQAGDGTPAP